MPQRQSRYLSAGTALPLVTANYRLNHRSAPVIAASQSLPDLDALLTQTCSVIQHKQRVTEEIFLPSIGVYGSKQEWDALARVEKGQAKREASALRAQKAERKQRRREAIVEMQSFLRGAVTRWRVSRIRRERHRRWRASPEGKRERRRQQHVQKSVAAVMIQSALRRHRAEGRFAAQRVGAVRVQRRVRGAQARQLAAERRGARAGRERAALALQCASRSKVARRQRSVREEARERKRAA